MVGGLSWSHPVLILVRVRYPGPGRAAHPCALRCPKLAAAAVAHETLQRTEREQAGGLVRCADTRLWVLLRFRGRADSRRRTACDEPVKHVGAFRLVYGWMVGGAVWGYWCCCVAALKVRTAPVYRSPSRCVEESLPSHRRRGGSVQLHGQRVLTQPSAVWVEWNMHAAGHPKRSCAAPV